MNHVHDIYHHMDISRSVGLVQRNFSNPGYLVVQCLVCATVLFPGSITPGGPQIHHFIKFFLEGMPTHESVLSYHIMAIIDIVNAV